MLLALQDFLPPVLHATFLAAVTEFVWLPWKEAVGGGACDAEGATQGGSQVRGASPATAAVLAGSIAVRCSQPTLCCAMHTAKGALETFSGLGERKGSRQHVFCSREPHHAMRGLLPAKQAPCRPSGPQLQPTTPVILLYGRR